jgi:hypothetical protein
LRWFDGGDVTPKPTKGSRIPQGLRLSCPYPQDNSKKYRCIIQIVKKDGDRILNEETVT